MSISRQERRRLQRDPAFLLAEGYRALEAGDWEGAETLFRDAVKIAPNNAELCAGLGLTYVRLDKPADAIKAFRRALALRPNDPAHIARLGVALAGLRMDEEAEPLLRRAVAADPSNTEARTMLGMVLGRIGDVGESLAILDVAVEDSSDPWVHAGRVVAMLRQGWPDRAVAAAEKTLALDPNNESAQNNLLFAWTHASEVTAAKLLEVHRDLARRVYDPLEQPLPARPRPAADAKPVIGLVSADLRRHPVSYLTLRAFEELAARGYRIFCFPTHENAGTHHQAEYYTQRFHALSAGWIPIREMSDEEARARIIAEGVDMLFDLSGHTDGNRLKLFARRAAPVQVSWAAYVGTTGLKTMDALIADAIEIPPGEEDCYTETVLRMPHSYICYEPNLFAPDVLPSPREAGGPIRFGAFQRASKISNALLDVWARLLTRVEGSVIELRYFHNSETMIQRRIIDRMTENGIAPERILFNEGSSETAYLEALGNLDIALDTHPYSGGVTTLEALWMGVPVVTWAGNSFAGRHSASHLSAIGLADWVTGDPDSYVDKLVALASDPGALIAWRGRLRDQMAASPICDPVRFSDAFEEIVVGFWRRRVDGAG